MGRIFITLTTAGLLAACGASEPETARALPADLTPPGLAKRGHSVDPMIVADRLMAAGQPELALEAYVRAGEETGFDTEVMSAIATTNIALGRLNQAEPQLRQLIEEEPKTASHWNNLGVILLEKKQYGEAKRVFERAFALDRTGQPEIRENLRVALAKMEKTTYTTNQTAFTLVREGGGTFRLTQFP